MNMRKEYANWIFIAKIELFQKNKKFDLKFALRKLNALARCQVKILVNMSMLFYTFVVQFILYFFTQFYL